MYKSVRALLFLGVIMSGSVTASDDLRNRAEIAEALANYSYRWDGKDAEGFAQLFTEDAVMERWQFGELVEGSVVEGRELIFKYSRAAHTGRLADRQTRHHFTGLLFKELSETHAVTENMALITHQQAGGRPFITATGVYRITWRKTAEGWLMVKRVLFSDAVPGEQSR